MLRILIVSPGHSPHRSNRQPWAYICGIARQLRHRGHDVLILGDGPASSNSTKDDHPEVGFVDTVRRPKHVVERAKTFDPDVCLWSLAPSASLFLWSGVPRVANTMGAIVPGPVYSPRELGSQLSPRDLRDLAACGPHVASALVPRRLFTRFLRRYFDRVIASTQTIVDWLADGSISQRRVHCVPHGRETQIADVSTEERDGFRAAVPDPPESDYLLNFGPPRRIRGVHDFVDAVFTLRDRGLDVEGVMLSRIDNEDDRNKLEGVTSDLLRRGGRDRISIVDQQLTRTELVRYIENAAVVSLPYRIVQSTVPISILEALELGCPVVTTNVNGSRELVPSANWTVPAGNANAIASAIEPLVERDPKTENLAGHLLTWERSVEPLADALERGYFEPIEDRHGLQLHRRGSK